ncbi:MAG: cation transporter [Candidatus Zixiibacteriota bacterium]
MKKVTLLGLAVVAMMAMALAYTVVAGEKGSCTAEQKAACEAKGEKASMTSATGEKSCAGMSMAQCDKMCDGMSKEECAALCKELTATNAKWEMRHISVTGMTCGGCESSVTTALTKTPGVLKVIKVDHKTGMALVAVDPAKSQDASLTSAVVNNGFKAEIIPAVAHTTTGDKMAGGKMAGGKACCASKDGASASSTDKSCHTEETKTETTTGSTPH